MWSVLDNLNAMIVTPVVVVLSLGIFLATQQDRIDTISRTSGVHGTFETTDWIERDLKNLGAGVPEGEPVLLNFTATGPLPSLTFRAGTDTSVVAPPRTIRYERAAVTDSTFELRRYEVGASGETLTARSMSSYSGIELDLKSRDGRSASDLSDAHAVSIRLTTSPERVGDKPVEWRQEFYVRNDP